MSATTELRPDSESPKRLLVLDAAAGLFMAHGYGAVSMDAVARAAGVSKATLYAHFSSKDQLFATIIGVACREKIALGALLPADATDIRAALATFGDRLLRFFLDERPLALHRVVIGESTRFPELGRAFYDNGPAALHAMFGAWLAGTDGSRPPCRQRPDDGGGAVRRHAPHQPVPACLAWPGAADGRRDRCDRNGGGHDLPEGLRCTLVRLDFPQLRRDIMAVKAEAIGGNG